MRTEYIVGIMIVLGGLFIFLVYIFDVPIISNATPILVFAFIVIILIVGIYYAMPYFTRGKSGGSGLIDSLDAMQYLQDRWFEARHEKLAPIDAKAIPGWFEDRLFYAFRMTKTSGEEGNIMVALVQAQPRDLMFEENPSAAEIRDPFLILGSEYKPAPIKNAKPRFKPEDFQRPGGDKQVVYVGGQPKDEIEKFQRKKEEDDE